MSASLPVISALVPNPAPLVAVGAVSFSILWNLLVSMDISFPITGVLVNVTAVALAVNPLVCSTPFTVTRTVLVLIGFCVINAVCTPLARYVSILRSYT